MAIKRTKKKKSGDQLHKPKVYVEMMHWLFRHICFVPAYWSVCLCPVWCMCVSVCVCVSFQPKQLKMKNVPPVTSAPSIHWETWCIFMFVCSAHFPSHPIKFGSVYMYHKYALFRNVLQKINRMTALWDVVGFTSFDQFTFFTVSKSQLVIYQLNLDLVGA